MQVTSIYISRFMNEDVRSKDIRVLVIDDEESCLTSIIILLFGTGIEVFTALGGQKGLDFLEDDNNIDLILLDLMMSDIYGLDVLEKIKKNPKLKDIPVIIQTGISNKKEIDKALSLGAISCIDKPFDSRSLLGQINEALNTEE